MLAFNIYVKMNHLSMEKRQRPEKNLTSKSGNDKQPVNLSYKQLNKIAQHSSMYKGTDKQTQSKHTSQHVVYELFPPASAEKIEDIKCLGQWCFSVIYILLDSPHVTDHASFSTHQGPLYSPSWKKPHCWCYSEKFNFLKVQFPVIYIKIGMGKRFGDMQLFKNNSVFFIQLWRFGDLVCLGFFPLIITVHFR